MTSVQLDDAQKQPRAQKSAMSHGSRNLIILTVGAILLAGLTTGVSLFVYRQTGDIYLDRSRPGYLPDKEEASEESTSASGYSFPDSGELTASELEEYLTQLQTVIKRLDDLTDPYSDLPLTDESLGIPKN